MSTDRKWGHIYLSTEHEKCYSHSARSAFCIVQTTLSKINNTEISIYEKKSLLIVKFFVSKLNTENIYVSYQYFCLWNNHHFPKKAP